MVADRRGGDWGNVSVRYGFVIDQRKCIGCHACTVACKEENRVPLGAFRTWVKYVERGHYPDTRRYFAVLRCNHCDDAPCVTICPTVALYRRPDGIVDFDGDRCIGCKSCMQGCPYDALYIDPDTNTAAKCHYCAHRVEVGLEPACVVVCPERAIIAGDLDDPSAPIARLVATEQVQVRKAEQGTRPKVFYVGADAAALTPSMQASTESYAFASRPPDEVDLVRMVASVQNGGDLSRPVYDAPHQPQPWGWKVAAYLWTKSIAAGTLMMAAFGVFVGAPPSSLLVGVVPPLVALVFLALTTALLILDLKRPDRFHYILFKGNRRSWLVRGAWILIAYGLVSAAWLVAALTENASLMRVLALPAVVLAAGAAGYSAFLFGQAEGRDFWQSPLLLPHLLVVALVAGAASLLIVGIPGGGDPPSLKLMVWALAVCLVLEAGLRFAEFSGSHANVDATRAARLLTRGAMRREFWWGAVVAGLVLPLVLIPTPALPLAPVLALAGLWIYEDLWIKAGQSIPLS
ncbi:MAG TPA: 4Fe-4S dicluster domain-containing protein [Candidatus Acidoferrum sp.]|nr:4Fe-4S dicluster domain-containing protein [Candidatus Acidoferrum sp.]